MPIRAIAPGIAHRNPVMLSIRNRLLVDPHIASPCRPAGAPWRSCWPQSAEVYRGRELPPLRKAPHTPGPHTTRMRAWAGSHCGVENNPSPAQPHRGLPAGVSPPRVRASQAPLLPDSEEPSITLHGSGKHVRGRCVAFLGVMPPAPIAWCLQGGAAVSMRAPAVNGHCLPVHP